MPQQSEILTFYLKKDSFVVIDHYELTIYVSLINKKVRFEVFLSTSRVRA